MKETMTERIEWHEKRIEALRHMRSDLWHEIESHELKLAKLLVARKKLTKGDRNHEETR